ncbi:LacI family DNA-binding transcriptional regulator [Sinomonas sp. ASV322]|uniref:LacI family DNA-binding transcriptional regulator n=1 Tax=Sinomonas sp. ASV322 TaxID=3041920 RepID=UPI0027DD62C2|nr:LacI family DNA-binding transcriptional regulator [Sinomonas sp. ASV322]MDQ4502314.1 LacI family DNA-binding transcriptional regulator [Sinomonas sp. ASV322]
MAAVTLSEVARAAGVSPATASRVLNGSTRIPGAEVAERVRAAATSLGYIPNAQAQALARSSTGLLGLIVHDIADPYFSSIARGVQSGARELGKTLLLICTEGTPAEERLAVEVFTSRRADAIVLAGSRSLKDDDAADNAALLREAERYLANGGRLLLVGHPLVSESHRPDAGRMPGTSDSPRATAPTFANPLLLAIPNETLSRELARTLADRGFSRFAIAAGPDGLLTSDLRVAGFQRGLDDSGFPESAVYRSSFNRDGGFEVGLALEGAVRDAAAEGGRLCLFAVNDRMAMGLVAALRQRGLEAPADFAIAGFDDINTLEDFVPGLTTVRLPLEEIGRSAALAALTGETPPPAYGEVVLRESTAEPG